MPVMRQPLAQEDEVAGGEGPDRVADEPLALPVGEEGQLHLLVEMPMGALALHRSGLARPQDAFDLAERTRPAKHAEGTPLGQLNVLADGFHGLFVSRDTLPNNAQMR